MLIRGSSYEGVYKPAKERQFKVQSFRLSYNFSSQGCKRSCLLRMEKLMATSPAEINKRFASQFFLWRRNVELYSVCLCRVYF